MYGSKTITEHVLRGLGGAGALYAGISFAHVGIWVPLLGVGVALVAFRGCPTCWIAGLGETIAARAQGREKRETCADGRCGRAE